MDPHNNNIGAHPAGDNALLKNSAEWSEYVSEPSPITYGRLLAFADASQLRPNLIPAWAELFQISLNWRTAQHLAQECLTQEYPELALYYARRAVEISEGSAIARITLTRAYWEQRFCEAALFQADLTRDQLLQFDTGRRAALYRELADLYANIYIYIRDNTKALPWLRQLLNRGTIRGETLCAALVAFHEEKNLEITEEIATRLAPHLVMISGRHGALATRILRIRFLRLLRTTRGSP